MLNRSLVAPGIVLLMLWSCAAPPSTVPSARLEVPTPAADGAGADPEGMRARIGPVFDDDTRSEVPKVGQGPSYYQGPTGIAEGAVAMVRGTGLEQQVAVFDARTGKELAPGAKPAWTGPSAPKVSADGKYLAYVTTGLARQEMVLWDLQRNQRVALPPLDAADIREVDLSGDGERLIYVKGSRADAKLCLLDRKRGEEREIRLPQAHMSVRAPTLSADGRTAAFVAASPRGDANIFLIDLATHRPISPPTLNSVDQDTDPALDARGQVVLFASDRNGSYDLFAYHLKSGQFLDMGVFNSLDDETLPRFLGEDDAGIAYVSTRDGGPVAYMHPFWGWR